MTFKLYDVTGYDEPLLLSDQQVALLDPDLEVNIHEGEAAPFFGTPALPASGVPQSAQGPYRPEDHTITEVLEYVGDDDIVAAAVRSLEEARGDKARSTLVNALTAIAEPA